MHLFSYVEGKYCYIQAKHVLVALMIAEFVDQLQAQLNVFPFGNRQFRPLFSIADWIKGATRILDSHFNGFLKVCYANIKEMIFILVGAILEDVVGKFLTAQL